MIRFCPSCGYDLETVEKPKEDILSGYETGDEIPEGESVTKGIEIAQPTVLDNRQRLHKLATRPAPMLRNKRMDSDLDSFSYKGESLFFGEGLQQTY